MPSVLDRIRELDEQKAQLLEEAKQDALSRAQAAVQELNELGFQYRLTEGGANGSGRQQQARQPRESTSTRRSGIREDVLGIVTDAGPDGVTSGEVARQLGADDKAGKQAVANALAALSKDGKVKQDGRGQPYRAV